jgi:carboxymethylenebutenolidase
MNTVLNRIATQWINLGGDGRFQGLLALPPAGKGPGLVVFQEIFGVNSHIQGVAQQYALDGFVVLAPDLFWRSQPKVQLGYEGDDRARGIEMMRKLTPADVESDVKATVSALRGRPETAGRKAGAIGYCFGGRLAFFAAALTDIDASVAYYGGGIHDQLDRVGSIKCPMQFHYAEHDDNIPLTAVDKVRGATQGHRAEVFIYEGAHHGFNCWDRASYNPRSAAIAHGRSLAFLGEQLF